MLRWPACQPVQAISSPCHCLQVANRCRPWPSTHAHTRESTLAYLGALSLAQKFHFGDRGQASTSSTNQLPANRKVNDSKSPMSSCWMIRSSVDDCIIDWQLPGHMFHSLPMPVVTSQVCLFGSKRLTASRLSTTWWLSCYAEAMATRLCGAAHTIVVGG